jgi:hypothetical protein
VRYSFLGHQGLYIWSEEGEGIKGEGREKEEEGGRRREKEEEGGRRREKEEEGGRRGRSREKPVTSSPPPEGKILCSQIP